MAVPFFFVSSGYFFFKKILIKGFQITILRAYIKKILTIYLSWTAVYLPFFIIFRKTGIVHESGNMVVNFFWSLFFKGSYYHLWFFPALIFSVILLFYMAKSFRLSYILILFFILYLVGLLGDSYYYLSDAMGFRHWVDIYRKYFGHSRNGLFFGMIYVTSGAYIARIEGSKFFKEINWKHLTILFSLLILEVYLVKQYHLSIDNNMYISLLPFSFILFIVLLKTELPQLINYKVFRDYSLFIYAFHVIPLEIISLLVYYQLIAKPGSFLLFVVSVVLSVCFSYIASTQRVKNIIKIFHNAKSIRIQRF